LTHRRVNHAGRAAAPPTYSTMTTPWAVSA